MTIEERAKERIKDLNNAMNNGKWLTVEEVYVIGATDQKKRDIEKACEWLKEHKLLNDEYKGLYTRYGGLSEFRKAMEE